MKWNHRVQAQTEMGVGAWLVQELARLCVGCGVSGVWWRMTVRTCALCSKAKKGRAREGRATWFICTSTVSPLATDWLPRPSPQLQMASYTCTVSPIGVRCLLSIRQPVLDSSQGKSSLDPIHATARQHSVGPRSGGFQHGPSPSFLIRFFFSYWDVYILPPYYSSI
jgi:hypothetical protein